MSLKNQLLKIKENWLLILVLVLFLLFSSSENILNSISSKSTSSMGYASDSIYNERMATSSYYPNSGGDFAPEIEERKITKNAFLSSEVERGSFYDSEIKLKNILDSSDSIILSERTNKYGLDKKSYLSGSYTVKVDTTKYDSVISSLKDIGEITSFSESQTDITARFSNILIELDTEKQRLARYEILYDEAKTVEDKIKLDDRIFNQERRVKYLEDQKKNVGQRVDYSTIQITMNEERSSYINVALVKFSALARSFVNSINSLLTLFFVLIPWLIVGGIIMSGYKFFKRE